MFIENKYSRWYYNIIANANARVITPNSYTEKHHVIPKSLGGSNDKSNLVRLTAKEHFICHMLLTRMTEGAAKRKMWHAAWTMATLNRKCQFRYKIPSRTYEQVKTKNASALSIANTGKIRPEMRKPKSEETKRKMSLAAKGRQVTPQAREAAIAACTGRIPHNKGKPISEEHREKLRIARYAYLARRKIGT